MHFFILTFYIFYIIYLSFLFLNKNEVISCRENDSKLNSPELNRSKNRNPYTNETYNHCQHQINNSSSPQQINNSSSLHIIDITADPSSPILNTQPKTSSQIITVRQLKRSEFKKKSAIQKLKERETKTLNSPSPNYHNRFLPEFDKLNCFYTNATSLNTEKMLELAAYLELNNV